MAHGLSARRKVVLASAALAFALVSLCGTGSALASERVVIAENFTNTG